MVIQLSLIKLSLNFGFHLMRYFFVRIVKHLDEEIRFLMSCEEATVRVLGVTTVEYKSAVVAAVKKKKKKSRVIILRLLIINIIQVVEHATY